MATLNGRVYTLATLRGSSGYAYATSDDRGLPLWPDAIFTDMLAELDYVKAGGGLVSGSLGVSAGDKVVTLTEAMSLPAGLYLAYRTSELNAPVNGFFGVLGTAINAGTSGTLTVGTSGLIGTGGTYGDFVLVPAPARRQPQRLVSSSDVATSDFGAVIRFTGATGGTLGIPVGSLGAGFPFSVVNNGTGTFILDPSGTLLIGTAGTVILQPKQALDLYVDGTGVSILSSYGYGAFAWGRHGVYVDAAAMRALGTSGASYSDSGMEVGADFLRADGFAFDPASIERVQIRGWVDPKSDGTALTLKFLSRGGSAGGTGTGGVTWGARAAAVNFGAALAGTFGGSQLVTGTFGAGTGTLYLSSETSTITIGGVATPGNPLWIEILRSATGTDDSYPHDAILQGAIVYGNFVLSNNP